MPLNHDDSQVFLDDREGDALIGDTCRERSMTV
jgi:hypothetical protein